MLDRFLDCIAFHVALLKIKIEDFGYILGAIYYYILTVMAKAFRS